AQSSGGGIYNVSSQPRLHIQHSTIAHNIDDGVVVIGAFSLASIRHSIIANNTGTDCAGIGQTVLGSGDPQASNPTLEHTLIGDGSCSSSRFGDPKLGPLADNGGSTLTHALLPDSPAINPKAGCFSRDITTDQRNEVRDLDCDLGAYEVGGFQSNTKLNISIVGQGSVRSTRVDEIHCPDDCEAVYERHEFYDLGSISLTAREANLEWEFRGWAGDCTNDDNSPSLEINLGDILSVENYTCIANFVNVAGPPGLIRLPDVPFSQYIFNENDGSIAIEVNREGVTDNPGFASIDYALTPGTAIPGEDYQDISGTLTWADGEAGNKLIIVQLIDDDFFEVDEVFTLTLMNPLPLTARLGSNEASLVIIDDDQDKPINVEANQTGAGRVQFVDIIGHPSQNRDGTLFVTVPEDVGRIRIEIERAEGDKGEVSVDVNAVSNTADFLSDFTSGTSTLTWSDQNSDRQSFSLNIIDDTELEPIPEALFIDLRNPSNGLRTADPDRVVITIQDNDECFKDEQHIVIGIEGEIAPVTACISGSDNSTSTINAEICSARNPGLSIQANGTTALSASCFVNLLNGQETPAPFNLLSNASTHTAIRIHVNQTHQGQAADILLIASFKPIGATEHVFLQRIDEIWNVYSPSALSPLPAAIQRLSVLPARVDVVIDDGPLVDIAGEFGFYVGYRLDDGTLVYNANSVQTWVVK
ncbi:MAG: Calx-beta domain-containing protein, partial [Pseudomonadota bacterium]